MNKISLVRILLFLGLSVGYVQAYDHTFKNGLTEGMVILDLLEYSSFVPGACSDDHNIWIAPGSTWVNRDVGACCLKKIEGKVRLYISGQGLVDFPISRTNLDICSKDATFTVKRDQAGKFRIDINH